jgi:thiamine biosynthesis protein ThiS
MQIVVNGNPRELSPETTIAELLDELRLPPIRVAVEVNEELVSRRVFDHTELQPGDRIEIVTLVGGG